MTDPDIKTPPKGISLVAAYRAERLNQRPLLRASLRQTHADLRSAREARLHETERPAAPDPVQNAPLDPAQSAPDDPPVLSVFANLIGLSLAERAASETLDQPAEAESAAADSVDPTPYVAPEHTAPPVDPPLCNEHAESEKTGQSPPDSQPHDPPLAEIGFGPGMLIRLSHIGVHSTGDLAKADGAALRQALGDISRLVDVDAWIRNAKESCALKT